MHHIHPAGKRIIPWLKLRQINRSHFVTGKMRIDPKIGKYNVRSAFARFLTVKDQLHRHTGFYLDKCRGVSAFNCYLCHLALPFNGRMSSLAGGEEEPEDKSAERRSGGYRDNRNGSSHNVLLVLLYIYRWSASVQFAPVQRSTPVNCVHSVFHSAVRLWA